MSEDKKSKNKDALPVTSFLISGEQRPHVASFFTFARTLEDLANDPDLMPPDKLARLEMYEKALLGEHVDKDYEVAERMCASLKISGVSAQHCLDILNAFRMDVTKSRYDTWENLLEYCSYSAAPVGRYLIDLHGENQKIYPLADALSVSLQLINHVQDCGEDYQNLDRIYFPANMMAAHKVSLNHLSQLESGPELMALINDYLDKTETILDQAETLPSEIKSKTMAMESAVLIKIAKKLCRRLRKKDPLKGHVGLNRFQYISAGFRGIFSLPSL